MKTINDKLYVRRLDRVTGILTYDHPDDPNDLNVSGNIMSMNQAERIARLWNMYLGVTDEQLDLVEVTALALPRTF